MRSVYMIFQVLSIQFNIFKILFVYKRPCWLGKIPCVHIIYRYYGKFSSRGRTSPFAGKYFFSDFVCLSPTERIASDVRNFCYDHGDRASLPCRMRYISTHISINSAGSYETSFSFKNFEYTEILTYVEPHTQHSIQYKAVLIN